MGFGSFSFIIKTTLLIYSLTCSSAVDSINRSQLISDGGRTLVSNTGSFELGFFSPASSNKNRYLGVWYKTIPIRTVVWVANRCNPINDSSGTLMISNTNNIVLLGQNKTIVWFTNTSIQAQKPILQVLDSGNVVLRDANDENSENYLWQSFDHPSDTLLPNMKIGWDLRTGINRGLSSWRNPGDPCPEDFTYGLELGPHTYPEAYIRKGTAKYYRTGPWNGLRFSGSPKLRHNPVYAFHFVYNDDEVYYMYNLQNSTAVARTVINQTTGTRDRLKWIEAEKIWKIDSYAPRDYCDNYGVCGANGICDIIDNPVCRCLTGFKPRSLDRWNLMDWSQGCERSTPLSCSNKDGFIKFGGIKLPDTTHTWVNKSMSLNECKHKCLENCSCMAYMNSDIRGDGSGCVIWFGDLVDIRQLSVMGQDLYIRMRASQIAKNEHKVKTTVIIIAVTVVGLIPVVISVIYYICRRKGSKPKDIPNSSEITNHENEGNKEDLELPLFDLCTIATATNDFSFTNKLGEGGYGPVYKGVLEDGLQIAVKRLSLSSGQGANEFKNEVRLIANLQHRNLVKLLGCCVQGGERLLVYEYLPNKSLDAFLFDLKQSELLKWPMRFQIICGIARGLLYLHQDSRLRIIHRDLKASNILLDKEMNPKISDFGIARTCGGDQTEGNTNRIVGTYGYMAPEYAFDGLFSIKSDVFSFGILLLEIVSGQKSSGFHHENDSLTLIGYAWTLMTEGRSFELIDPYLRDLHDLAKVLRSIHIGLLCVQQNPVDRPNMSSVVLMLSSDSALSHPKEPGYFMKTNLLDNFYSPNQHVSISRNDMSITALEAR